MNIRILGCHGSQVPGCNTTSFLVEENVLIDAGSITSTLTAEEQVKVDYIFVTHAHLDHVKEMMFMVDNLWYLQKSNPLTIVSIEPVIHALKTHLFNGLIWPDFSSLPNAENPVLRYEILEVGGKRNIGSFAVTAISVNHTVETVSYVIETGQGSMIFIGDTGPTEEIWKVANSIEDLKAIFVETSLPDEMNHIAEMTGHLTPAMLMKELFKLNNKNLDIYLYHMKDFYSKLITRQVAAMNQNRLHILEDGQTVRI
ncbi:3',5'-cyclic-nucleotide phosphodiesterase [Syntrophus aciditrophicus]|uniref:Metallo-beta-lactamase superfamily protein n=1 Tax=Syntrophus aciditrophicus (strain SB) TaxID=56780 RepID=Q2LQC6_SYNAS|nr:3',5'-cyclic-nucleotide phosphodiesterase [Syntrophus aciditrophicus]ABC76210.1 metallo-beta-lactamase superfamily protein [Syntrophus aciditrophicus SB]OPY17634.1 MAG: ribonuclease Z [Syntrophus sp. PtaB.Bin075]